MDIGSSFSPTAASQQDQQGRAQPPINPVQDAIRILSFKIPSLVGASSPVPQALLGNGFGSPFGALATQWLRNIFGPALPGSPIALTPVPP